MITGKMNIYEVWILGFECDERDQKNFPVNICYEKEDTLGLILLLSFIVVVQYKPEISTANFQGCNSQNG